MSEQYQERALRRGGGAVYEVAELGFDLFFAKRTAKIFQGAETVNNVRPLHVGGHGTGPQGLLPGPLWKDCERIKGRPGEVMSAVKTSPPGPHSPTLGT